MAVAGVLVVPGLSGSAAGTGTGAVEGCETLTHPLGDATPYTEFVETHGVRGSESEGAIAYGGDLGANGMTVGTRLTSAASAPTLVVGGSHGQWFNLQRGSAWVVPRSGVNFNGGGSYLDANPLDITTAFTGLRALAARIAATGGITRRSPTSSRRSAGDRQLSIRSGAWLDTAPVWGAGPSSAMEPRPPAARAAAVRLMATRAMA